MRILFVADWWPTGMGRWLAEGFEEAGHYVIRAGRLNRGHWGVDWESYPAVDLPLPFGEPIDLAALVAQTQADLVIIWVLPETRLSSVSKTPIVTFVGDGWPAIYAAAEAIPAVARFTAMPFGVREHPDDAFSRGWKLCSGAAKWESRNSGPRPIDACMLGGAYPERMALAHALVDAGLIPVVGQRNVEGYVDTLSASLALVAHTCRQSYIPWRVFEAMGLGAVAVIDTDARTEFQFGLLGLRAGEHYVTVPKAADGFPDRAAVIETLKRLRADGSGTGRIVRAARAAVLTRHTYRHRAEMMLAAAGFGSSS